MNFFSIKQYFNKLYSVLLVVLIVPLLVFITLFFLLDFPATPPDEYLFIIAAAALIDWLVAMLIFDKKIKSLRKEQGLGTKLDKYFRLTIVRYGLFSSGSFILAAGLYLWRNDLFTALYLAGLVFAGIVWPTGRKVCSDLRLRGDERQMVYFKKDVF